MDQNNLDNSQYFSSLPSFFILRTPMRRFGTICATDIRFASTQRIRPIECISENYTGRIMQ